MIYLKLLQLRVCDGFINVLLAQHAGVLRWTKNYDHSVCGRYINNVTLTHAAGVLRLMDGK